MHDLTVNRRGSVHSPDAGVASTSSTGSEGHLCIEPSWEKGLPVLVPFVSCVLFQSRHRRVSFAEEVTMLSADASPESSQLIPPLILPVVVEEVALASETGVPPLILLVVEELVNDTLAVELFGVKTPAPESGVPPPPGFLPFLFPENDGGMDANDICARFGGVTALTLSLNSRESSDIPHAPDVLPVGALCPPSQDS